MTEGSDNKKPYETILSLDGGGIRGIITARILQEIEKKTGKRIHELFDLIVGTSAGGILAAGLAGQPSKNYAKKHTEEEVPPYTAKKMVGFFQDEGHNIFTEGVWKKLLFKIPFLGRALKKLAWVSDKKYSSEPLDEVLEELLGDAKLEDTKLDIIATSYDIKRREPYLFKTSKARSKKGRNHLLRDVARATSAAPTYFEPLLLDNERWDSEKTRRALIDGGVFANNPSMIALSEALSPRAETESSGAKMEDILLCAIGTGTNNREILYDDAKKWGRWGWAKPLVNIVMDGMSDSAHHLAQQLLPSSKSDDKQEPDDEQRYFRFNIELEHASDDLDDASDENIGNLLKKAEEIIAKQGAELDQLVKALKSRQPGSQGTGGQGTDTGS